MLATSFPSHFYGISAVCDLRTLKCSHLCSKLTQSHLYHGTIIMHPKWCILQCLHFLHTAATGVVSDVTTLNYFPFLHDTWTCLSALSTQFAVINEMNLAITALM